MKKLKSLGALALSIHITDFRALCTAVLADLLTKLALLMQCLDLITTTKGAATNKNIRDGVALGSVGKEGLDSQAVADDVEFDDVWAWLDVVHIGKIVLGFLGVWTVRLGEDDDLKVRLDIGRFRANMRARVVK